MKILISGGAGFIGSALIRHIINNSEHIVINVDKVHHMAAQKVSLQCAKAIDTFDFKANQDSIEGFGGNWIYVSDKKVEGYVFDAYISSLPFVEDFEALKNLGENLEGIFEVLPDILEEYAVKGIGKTGCEFKYPPLMKSESAHGFVFNKLKNGHNLINHGYWEGYGTELEFYNLRKSEIYYFIMHLTSFIPIEILEVNEQLLKNLNSSYSRNHCIDKNYFGFDCSLRVFQKEGNIVSVFFSFFT